MTKKKEKGIFIILGLIIVVIFIFQEKYTESTSYFGFIEIRELEKFNNTYKVTVEGDFGTKTTEFKGNDYFDIVEEEFGEGNIIELWNHLSKDKIFHVLLKSYNNRDEFELKRIYID